MRLAIDVMGSDHSIEVSIAAAIKAVNQFDNLKLILVGDSVLIKKHLGTLENIEVMHAKEVVELTDRPSLALRKKRQSSMHLAIDQVSLGHVDGCVSCGNTGALMAIGRHKLKTLPGIDRPAIIKAIPSMKGKCYLLDLGANINCDAENLLQFAVMGSLMCGAVEGIERPRVGLLNIGEEEIKGEDQVKLAADLLKENSAINYIGFVEGDGIYRTDVDVIVCDGWVGNIALKTSEGLASFIRQLIENAFTASLATRIAGMLAYGVLSGLKAKLQSDRYNGASLLGLNGTVVKSHSNSTVEGMYQAIRCAMKEVEQNIPGLIEGSLNRILVS